MGDESDRIGKAIKDILSGTMGGFAQVLAGHPLDTVKVRLQNQKRVTGQTPQFNGMIDTFRKTVQMEGFKGLYKGATSPLAGAMAHNAGVFFSYGQAKEIVAAVNGRDVTNLHLSDYFFAGAIVGGIVSHVEGPIDLLKVKLQAQVGKGGQYSGVLDCTKQLIRERGLLSLYQGYTSVQLRNVPAFGLYFYFFEQMKQALQALTPPGQAPTLYTTFFAGGWAGFGFWGLTYPLDVIKTRMQTDATHPKDRLYRSTAHCISSIYRADGLAGFFHGYTPALIRAIFVNACIFYAVSAAKVALTKSRTTHADH